MRSLVVLAVSTVVLAGCKPPPPEAEDRFNDAARRLISDFEGDPAAIAQALRWIEVEVYTSMDLDASSSQDRALSPAPLTMADIEGIDDRTDLDPSVALPVAVARTSEHEVWNHRRIPLLTDQTLVEPYSPDHYERTFLDGTDVCFEDRSCDTLYTFNFLTKQNALMTVPYELHKWYRWVDLAVEDPDGDPVDTSEPRWAFVARSWQPDSFSGDSGNTTLVQSYSLDIWLPRDGRGFTWDGVDNPNGYTHDSAGGGAIRLMAVWSETDLGVDVGENAVIGTTRKGMDDIFQVQDEYLAANPDE